MTWPVQLLSDVASVKGGRTPKALDRYLAEHPHSGRDVPFYKVGDLGTGRRLSEARVHLAADELRSLGVEAAPAGTVVFPKAGGAIATNKKRLVSRPGPVDLNCMAVTPGADVDPQFLLYWFESFDLTSIADGSVLPQISRRRVASLQIPVPSPSEQRRTVEILEDHLSHLDAAADYESAARRRIQVMQKSTLLQLIPDQDHCPSDWIASTVAQAGKVELGRQRHPDWHTGPNMQPYLRVANVFEDRIDTSDVKEMHWDADTFERFRLHPGDVLLNEGQTPDLLGRPALYRGEPANVAFTNSLIRFKAHPEVLPEFALLVFRRHMHAGRFKRESRITTNIAHLSAARLKPIEFPIPPLETQKEIVQAAVARLEDIARLDRAISSQRRRAENLRRAVLAAAFSGKLAGRHTDDEVIDELAGAMA